MYLSNSDAITKKLVTAQAILFFVFSEIAAEEIATANDQANKFDALFDAIKAMLVNTEFAGFSNQLQAAITLYCKKEVQVFVQIHSFTYNTHLTTNNQGS